MSISGDLPALNRQLENYQQELQHLIKPRQIKQIEKDLQFLYDEICSVYPKARPDHRVDLSVTLEFRNRLLAQFIVYAQNTTKQAQKLTGKKRQAAQARQLVRQGLTALTIIRNKVIASDIEDIENDLQSLTLELDVDSYNFTSELEIPYRFYVQRAIQYQKGRERVRALKALSLALALNPKLENNDRVAALASVLTGESELSGLLTIADPYVLKKFIQNLERAELDRQAPPEPKSTMEVIRSWFTQ